MGFKSHLYGIEISIEVVCESEQDGLNRTFMELKCGMQGLRNSVVRV